MVASPIGSNNQMRVNLPEGGIVYEGQTVGKTHMREMQNHQAAWQCNGDLRKSKT